MMWQGAELSALPGGGELREEVFVVVAPGIAVLGGDAHITDDGDCLQGGRAVG
jgi:hypothetical protein